MTEDGRPWAPPRRLAGAFGVGFVVGVLLTLGLVAAGDPLPRASGVSFAVAGLCFGFAVTVWASAVWIGEPLGNVLDAASGGETDWSTAAAGRAFSLLTSLGLGGMVGVSILEELLRALG